jgi:hypothetical protein
MTNRNRRNLVNRSFFLSVLNLETFTDFLDFEDLDEKGGVS